MAVNTGCIDNKHIFRHLTVARTANYYMRNLAMVFIGDDVNLYYVPLLTDFEYLSCPLTVMILLR